MPTDACQYLYTCKKCGHEMKPKQGDCCVFCSFGDVPCPPIQEAHGEYQGLMIVPTTAQ